MKNISPEELAEKVGQLRVNTLRGHISNSQKVGKVINLLGLYLQNLNDSFLFDAYDSLYEICEEVNNAIKAEHSLLNLKEELKDGSRNDKKTGN